MYRNLLEDMSWFDSSAAAAAMAREPPRVPRSSARESHRLATPPGSPAPATSAAPPADPTPRGGGQPLLGPVPPAPPPAPTPPAPCIPSGGPSAGRGVRRPPRCQCHVSAPVMSVCSVQCRVHASNAPPLPPHIGLARLPSPCRSKPSVVASSFSARTLLSAALRWDTCAPCHGPSWTLQVNVLSK